MSPFMHIIGAIHSTPANIYMYIICTFIIYVYISSEIDVFEILDLIHDNVRIYMTLTWDV